MTNKTTNPGRNRNTRGRGIQKHIIDEVNRVYPILEVAKKLELKTQGNKKINCINPAHPDMEFSMVLDEASNTLKCYVCGKKVANLELVQLTLNITHRKAVEFIKGQIDYPEWYKKQFLYDKKSEEDGEVLLTKSTKPHNDSHRTKYEPGSKRSDEKQTDDNVDYNRKRSSDRADRQNADSKHQKNKSDLSFGESTRIYKTFWENLVPLSRFQIGIDYFRSRSISGNTLDKLGIRFIVDEEKVFKNMTRKYPLEKLIKSSLFAKPKDENEKEPTLIYELHKVIIPFFKDHFIVDIYGRSLTQQDPLFISLFDRIMIPYNYNGLNATKEGKRLYVCSNMIDTITLIDRGYENTIGFLDAHSVPQKWIDTFSKYKIILVTGNGAESDLIVRKIGAPLKKNQVKVKAVDINKVLSIKDSKEMDKIIEPVEIK